MKGFLYGQTEYNLLSNANHLTQYIQKALDNSFTFLSMTDKNLYGSYKFYQACKQNNLKPIIGIELGYIDDDGGTSKLLAYAKTNKGYRNLLKITTFLNTHEMPVGIQFLNEYKEDIAFIMVFNESILERFHFSKSFDSLNQKLTDLNTFFDFYVGYSDTNRLDRLTANLEIKKYCEARKIHVLPIHNCRYLLEEDVIIYEALTRIAGDPVEIQDYEDYSFYAQPAITEELEQFITSIELDLYTPAFHLPKYPKTKGATAKEFLTALCYKGLQKRLQGSLLKNYKDRLDYELSVIEKMGYCDYFLIVWDFILYAKKKNILVGPGRGSAAGSLVAYCLGITEIDPLKYDLLFERFLNPERISMPDIDTDFPDTERDEVIQYVKDLYGDKHVCSISAFNTFLMRSSIRDLGRILKMDHLRLDEMIRLVEETKDYEVLLEQFKERKDIYDFLYIIKGLEGLPRHISTHAAGIIISSEELDELIPLQMGMNGLYQSQFEASDLERIGLLKMDFLGIRNLSIIKDILNMLPQVELRNIPLNDKKTFQLLQRADTLGIFQLESSGIRKVLLKLKCETFDDLIAVLALYRPGPMDNIDEFIERRHGKAYSYFHPVLEPILKSTYGIIVYQEQIMLIAQKFANFSLGQADLLRRAVSKKKEEELKKIKILFVQGAIKNGYSQSVAEDIYNYILKFANYGFNKSHSVAYALLAYQMLYLKANYFPIFMSKILNNVIGSSKTLEEYIQYAQAHGVNTYKPNVNISTTIFEINKAGMFMPLSAIHSVGNAIANDIVRERNEHGLYKDFVDFKLRTGLSTSVLEAFIYAGALDGFGMSKKQMIESKEIYNEIIAKHLEDRIEDTSEYEFSYLRQKELEYLGFNLTYDLFINLTHYHQKYQATYLSQNGFRSIVSFETIKEITTKTNQKMLVGRVYDRKTACDFVIFPSDYLRLKQLIDRNKLFVIDYRMEKDKKTEENKIIIKNVMQV